MRVYALSDLHLSFSTPDKSMDKFGPAWMDHAEKIRCSWNDTVSADDLVIIAGDISWAMHFNEAADDLRFISELSGRKVMLRGNHDYWWSSIGALRRSLPEGFYAIQNDSVTVDGVTVAGTRGWDIAKEDSSAEDIKIYRREIMRLEMSLNHAEKSGMPVIGAMHFPPFSEEGSTEFTDIFEKHGVRNVVFGHMHGQSVKGIKPKRINGTEYQLTSCDYLDFSPVKILEI